MIVMNIKPVCRAIEHKMRFLPAYFYCQHSADHAPIRILLNGYRYWERGVLRREFEKRGFVVKFWKAKFNGYG